jgi:hypothetical protein
MSGGPAAHAVVLVEWAEGADTAPSGFDDTEVLVRVVGGEDESELATKCGPGDSQDEVKPSSEFEMLDNMLACHDSGQSCSADRNINSTRRHMFRLPLRGVANDGSTT